MAPSPTPSPSLQNSHWDPLVIALVGGICTIFLIVTYHQILHRSCCRTQVSYMLRNRAQRHRINEENHVDPSLQFQSQGLDSHIARSLPIVQFKKMNDAEMAEKTTECAVCLGEFEEGNWIKHLPNCCHVFHVSCIDIWFQTHSSCPLCRAPIFDLEQSRDLLRHLSREDYTEEQLTVRELLRMHVLESPSIRLQIDHET